MQRPPPPPVRTFWEGAHLHCPDCGYSLRGNISNQCPDCGCRVVPAEIVQYLDTLRRDKNRAMRIAGGVIVFQSVAFIALCHFGTVEWDSRYIYPVAFFICLGISLIVSAIHGYHCASFAAYDDFVSRGVRHDLLRRLFVAGVFFLIPMIIQCCLLFVGVYMVLGRMGAFS